MEKLGINWALLIAQLFNVALLVWLLTRFERSAAIIDCHAVPRSLSGMEAMESTRLLDVSHSRA